MKLTVLGGTGLIGSQVVQGLTAAGHQVVPAALSTGLDLITGKGLDQALEGAEIVVNVANSPTFDEASLGSFRTFMNVLARDWRRAYRGPGRAPGTHALPGLDQDGPVTGREENFHDRSQP
ncbi:hypothetical protein [Trebonia kvetii]|uniref:hypothetical protein n=1 Tax=Trebonia kvetii TaxID=2480626 RepID=UPI001C9E6B61|nr:hypothetical protein [Trebonia kvetii]